MKNKKFLPLLLLPILALTSCGEVHATVGDAKEPLIGINGNKFDYELTHNIKDIIYKAKLEGGNVASELLDEILFLISESVYGSYEELTKVAALPADNQEVKDFIAAHKAFRVELDKDAPDAKKELEAKHAYKRVKNAAARIETRIAKKMFNAISGSYVRNGKFHEYDYLMNLVNSLKDVKNPKDMTAEELGKLHTVLITPKFDETNLWRTSTNDGLLNKEFYEEYIKADIIPDLYRELLVEQYLFDNNYSTIGRSYARNVEILTINARANDGNIANRIMNNYVDHYINADNQPKNHGFDIVNTAWKGLNYDGEILTNDPKENGTVEQAASFLLNESKAEFVTGAPAHTITGQSYEYYKGTSYGEMITDLNKVNADPKLNDKGLNDSFTNNGAYTVSKGVQVKKDTITKENYITDGWYIRNSGLSNLSDEMRNRLFNIDVANALDHDVTDRFANDTYEVPEDENEYVAKIHGEYYLKPNSVPATDGDEKLKDILWIDSNAGSYTIIKIKDAVSSSKLSLTSDKNYEGLYEDEENNLDKGFDKREEVSHAIAEEIAKSDSYRTLSTKYWLEKANLTFHDEDMDKFFKDTYPEIFGDEKK